MYFTYGTGKQIRRCLFQSFNWQSVEQYKSLHRLQLYSAIFPHFSQYPDDGDGSVSAEILRKKSMYDIINANTTFNKNVCIHLLN